MSHAVYAQAPAIERDLEAVRSARGDRAAEITSAPSQGPWTAVLGLQRTAGNAAVTRMLQGRGAAAGYIGPFGGRHGSPTAPIAVSRETDDEWGESGSEWSSGGESESGAGSEWSGGGESAGGESESGAGSEWSGGGSSGGESAGGESESGAGSEWSGGGESAGGGESESAPVAEGSGGEAASESGSEWSSGESGAGSEWSGGGSGGGQGGGEEQTGDSGPSWWPFGGGDEESGEEGERGEGDGEHSEEDVDRKMAEGETGTESDVYVPTGGGPPPTSRSGGFHDDGRQGTVPFGGPIDTSDPDEALRPHAFTGGGQTGSTPWAGGGLMGGPKGNQGSGSLSVPEIVPEYDSSWGGPFSDADAWVRSGTGVADVHRDYVTSNSGDQGNGWWISSAAASALDRHEQRHVASSRSLYESAIQPALDRIGNSAITGKGKTYWQSDARALLKRNIGWEGALTKFKDEDKAYNGKNGQIDSEDYGSAGYPRNMHGPRKIQGKDYDNYLIMGSESDPT